jgi:hypothetical protein
MGDAVDKVRRKENTTLKAAGDDRLAGTRYDWLRNPASMEQKDRKEFAELRSRGRVCQEFCVNCTSLNLI